MPKQSDRETVQVHDQCDPPLCNLADPGRGSDTWADR
jgi:hypothetical protein